jgi:hypothetical protein
MDDAPASDDSGPGESTPRAVTIHVPVVYASDSINNPVLRAITDPQIRQTYLQEVGGRTIHMKDPLEPASSLPEPARYAMKAKLMDGFTNKMCVQGYIKHGGKVTEDDTEKAAKGVDKAYKSHVTTWFTAQNIVLPWAARKNTDGRRWLHKAWTRSVSRSSLHPDILSLLSLPHNQPSPNQRKPPRSRWVPIKPM